MVATVVVDALGVSEELEVQALHDEELEEAWLGFGRAAADAAAAKAAIVKVFILTEKANVYFQAKEKAKCRSKSPQVWMRDRNDFERAAAEKKKDLPLLLHADIIPHSHPASRFRRWCLGFVVSIASAKSSIGIQDCRQCWSKRQCLNIPHYCEL